MTQTQKILLTLGGLLLFSRLARAGTGGGGGTIPGGTGPADVDFRGTNKPRGIRNNNPGNLKYFGIGWQGEVGGDPTFSIFTAYKWGIRAMLKDLTGDYRNKGKKTLRALINEFAPNSENPTSNYVDFVKNATGINPDLPFSDTRNNWEKIVRAMARFENGQEAVTPEQFNQVWTEFNF